MVTKRSDIQSKGAATTAAPKTPAAKSDQDVKATPAPTTDPGQAAVIAQLVAGGMSYAQAVAAMAGNGETTAAPLPKVKIGKDPGADEVIDPDTIPDPIEELELFEVSHTPREGYKVIEELYEIRKMMETSRKKRRFSVNVQFDQRLFDWLVYATIAEATFRGRPDLTIEDFLTMRLKELKAADPSQGGRRDPSKSGPKESYNPATGKWK